MRNPLDFMRFFRNETVRFSSLFTLMVLIGLSSPAVFAKELCEDELKALQKTACLAECETYYQENPDSRPAKAEGTCETAGEFLASTWNFQRNKERFESCAQGAWKGVLSVPDQLKAYLMMVGDVGTAVGDHMREQKRFWDDCSASAECRREVARRQLHYSQRRPDGSYVVADAEVDRAIAGQDFGSLLMISNEHQAHISRSCESRLGQINREVQSADDFEEWNTAALQKRYRSLAAWDPVCPAILKMNFPEEPTPEAPGSGWLKTLGIKYQCHAPEVVNELVCLEIAQFILDPLALGTGGAALAAKAVRTAGLRRGAQAVRTEDSVLAAGSDLERRTGEGPRRTVFDPRTAPRDGYIAENLNKNATTTAQNEEWIRLAENSGPGANTRFFEAENSMMKSLNDGLKDKNLVTSLTNRHKELVAEQIEAVRRANPGLEVSPYSDFKSMRFAFSGKIPANLERQLDQAFQTANQRFANEMREKNLIRENDNPETWFRAGYGPSADQASAAARVGRTQGAENRLMSATSPVVQERLARDLRQAESSRQNLERGWGTSPLMTGSGGSRVPSQAAFDLVRKSNSPEELATAVRAKYGLTNFSATDAKAFRDYASSVDAFSPSLRIAKREIVNLDEAVNGGFSADFLGLGAANSHATASALAGKDRIDQALLAARAGEQNVTREFRGRMEAFRRAVGDSARCSGDDCIGIATKPLSTNEKVELLGRLAAQPETQGIRMSFISEGVRESSHRTLLSTHGESIEKALRTELREALPATRTDGMTFGIDMRTRAAHQGDVDVLIGARPGLQVTAEESQKIREALQRAIKKVNDQLKAEGTPSAYRLSP